MNPIVEGVLTTVGEILVAGGGAAAILYGCFARWGEKWLDSRFAVRLQELKQVHERELEASKQAHDRQLESAKQSIQSTFSRISKVHEREFLVLPKIWLMIHETLGQAAHAVGLTLIQIPNFRTMRDEDAVKFAASVGLTENQAERIMVHADPDERHKEFVDAVMFRNMSLAKENQRLLNNYVIENRIFMTPELDVMLTEVSATLGTGLGTFEIGRRSDYALERQGFDAINGLSRKLPPILRAIQERLCHDVAGVKMLQS